MKKARERDGRARLEEEIQKPIRPQVNRPHGFAVPDDPEAIKRENALMEELHQKAIAEAQRDKLKLLCRRYSLAEDNYRGLARNLAIEHEPRSQRNLRLLCRRYSLAENDYERLALSLAIQHEPGFRVVDRQITSLLLTNTAAPGFSGPVLIKDGVLIYERTGRPIDWPSERLLQLLEAVQTERKRSGVTKDLDALRRLARGKEWAPPPNHRGEFGAWVSTLQSRLHDAKKFKRQLDYNERTLEEAERRTRDDSESTT
jgi:hypothetical protein